MLAERLTRGDLELIVISLRCDAPGIVTRALYAVWAAELRCVSYLYEAAGPSR